MHIVSLVFTVIITIDTEGIRIIIRKVTSIYPIHC